MKEVNKDGIKPLNIWLAIPTYGGILTVATMKSILHDIFPLVLSGHKVRVFDEVGHADIYSARAQIVSHFLSDKDATDLVFIDNDVAWDAQGLHRLLAHPVDCVAGAYPKRDYPLKFMFRCEENVKANGETDFVMDGDPDTGLCEVWGMPAGFMKCSRSMLEQMWEHYKPRFGQYDHAVPSKETVRMFDPYFYEHADGTRRYLSEDYAFCQRWRDIGGKVWMDTQIPMAHIGTHAFTGCLGEWRDKPEGQAA